MSARPEEARLDVGSSVLSECRKCGDLHCIYEGTKFIARRHRWGCYPSCPKGEHLHKTERCGTCGAQSTWGEPTEDATP